MVKRSYASAHPEVTDRLAECELQGVRWLWKSEAHFAAIGKKLLPGAYTSAGLRTIWEAMRPVYGVNGGMWAAQEKKAWGFWAKYIDPSDAKKITSFTQIFNPAYAKWAVGKLGVIKGSPDAAGI